MLILLPLASFGATFLLLANFRPEWGWGKPFVRGLALCGTYLVVGTEVLSLFRGITPMGLSLVWLGPVLAVTVVLWRRARRGTPVVMPPLRAPRTWADRVLLGIVLFCVLVTGVIAWFAPPQTWDSLTYHTARVAHWEQNRSVAHYASGIERQNLMSPGAEMAVLHAYVLGGGDRFANFVQWGSMVACLVGAALIASRFGAGSLGKWFAAAFVATLPMGISEATSTMTDYVLALWMVIVAFETFELNPRIGGPSQVAYLGLAAGLAILTKPTSFAYLLPFALFVGVHLLRRGGLIRTAKATALVVSLALALNVGYLGRNVVTYGAPLGDPGKVTATSNRVMSLGVVFSNTLRNASLHMGTPWDEVNHWIFRLIVGVHFKLGMDVNDPRTSAHLSFEVPTPRPDEIRSGNPWQALIGLGSVIGVVGMGLRRRPREFRVVLYILLISASFVILSTAIKFTVFGSRYHVPFFILLAPVAAVFVDRYLPRWGAPLLGTGLLLAAWPWLFQMEPRAITPDRNGRSILTADRLSLYLPEDLEVPYREITAAILASSCRSVGVMLGGETAEYPLWPFLGEPRDDLAIEWIVAGNPSAVYRRSDFHPCAVVCDATCPAEGTVSDLPVRLDISGYRLFQAP